MEKVNNTQYFKFNTEVSVKDILDAVYDAMAEKGYNPVNQIVGYIMSGDPTYITSHKNARSMIMKVERDELVEELLKEYNKDKDMLISLNKALKQIKERERNVLVDRYIIGRTQMEIAESLDISQAQVSRIEKNAISNIKRLIK